MQERRRKAPAGTEEKSGEGVIIDQKQRRKSEESKDIQSKKRPKHYDYKPKADTEQNHAPDTSSFCSGRMFLHRACQCR